MKPYRFLMYGMAALAIYHINDLFAKDSPVDEEQKIHRKYNLIHSQISSPRVFNEADLAVSESFTHLQWPPSGQKNPKIEVAHVQEMNLPLSVDFSHKIPYIHEQKSFGSCTGQAITCAMEYNLFKSSNFSEKSFVKLSPLFVYYNERRLVGTTKTDSGSSLADGIRAIYSWGACSLKKHGDKKDFGKRPSKRAYDEAESYKLLDQVTRCRVSHDLNAIKLVLAQGNPVLLGIYIYSSFESEAVKTTGEVSIPSADEAKLGGHAMMLVGYDDKTRRFKAVNSHGVEWGDKGFCYLTYDYVMNTETKPGRRYTFERDIWTISTIGEQESEYSESSTNSEDFHPSEIASSSNLLSVSRQ